VRQLRSDGLVVSRGRTVGAVGSRPVSSAMRIESPGRTENPYSAILLDQRRRLSVHRFKARGARYPGKRRLLRRGAGGAAQRRGPGTAAQYPTNVSAGAMGRGVKAQSRAAAGGDRRIDALRRRRHHENRSSPAGLRLPGPPGVAIPGVSSFWGGNVNVSPLARHPLPMTRPQEYPWCSRIPQIHNYLCFWSI
jgi:hypothetical protein